MKTNALISHGSVEKLATRQNENVWERVSGGGGVIRSIIIGRDVKNSSKREDAVSNSVRECGSVEKSEWREWKI